MRPRYYDQPGELRVPGRPAYYVNRKGYFRGPNPFAPLDESATVYLTWWVKANHHLYETSNGFVWNKLLRYTAGNGNDDWTEQVEVESQNSYGTDDGCGDTGWDWFGPAHAELTPNTWHRVEMLLQGGGNLAAGSGRVDILFDGIRVAGSSSLFSCEGMLDHVYVWGSDPHVPELYPADSRILFGEFYLDTSRARVLLTDSDHYAFYNSQPTHWEVLPATAWGNSSITVDFHPGSFSSVEGLYLYVIDAAGNLSPPYRLGSAPPPPPPPDTTPPAPVADLACVAATGRSIRLTWTAVGDDGAGGVASFYDLRYATAPITPATWDAATRVSGEPTPKPAGQGESFTVGGLEPETTYYFALRTGDEVPNWSELSNVPSRRTLAAGDDSPPAAIMTLNLRTRTRDSIRLRWIAPGDDGNVGTAAAYDLRYATSPITEDTWAAATQVEGEPAPRPSGQLQLFLVRDLAPGKTYHFALRAADEAANWSGLSNVVTATTPGDATEPDGKLESSVAVKIAHPEFLRLLPASPNPFRHAVVLNYDIPEDAAVHFVIFSAGGRLVRSLRNGEFEAAGRHMLLWDGRDEDGRDLPGGVYFARLQAGGAGETRRILKIR